MCSILFVSDIHFGEFSRSKELAIPNQSLQDDNTGAKSIIEGIERIIIDEKIQFVIVGGDLTSKANPLEYYYCGKSLSKIMSDCNLPVSNLIISMGNHDLDYSISSVYENMDISWLTDEDKNRIKNYYREIAACTSMHCLPEESIVFAEKGPVFCSGVVDNEFFTCFVLNSSVFCDQNQKPNHGKLSSDQLEWLKTTAKKYEDNGKWKIVLLHHHPFSYTFPVPSGPDFSVLEEGSELVDIVSACGIDLVLHGHRHHPRAETRIQDEWRKPITFICAGSMSVNSKHRNAGEIPNTIHVIHLGESIGSILLKNYKYSSTEGWEPIKESTKEVPLDAEMMLGKCFRLEEIDSAIDSVFSPNIVISKKDLPECLRYQRNYVLNNKFKEKAIREKRKIISSFPEDIYIIDSNEERKELK